MSEQKPRLTRPVENVRAELLADPDTQRIAKSVGMELAAYVELVLDYAQHPEKEPVLQVVPDEALRAAGYDPPSIQEVGEFFKSAARGELGLGPPASYSTGFEATQAASQNKPSLRGDENQTRVEVDEATSQALLKNLPRGPDRL
ncbi:hypothetical protein HUA74_34740 [Myxococcus sp. CA051A]|uniref:Uncharacterized protein n=1 Tax=Myxococcus llanfairpwllgwyngyllgogerychwyrndrobwllllantysiliogogogochensis TaxID=2590453 RepID=A0A540X8F4_9BACT|nr:MULTISPECIES: hypothetical protein [Myxococcus]NTX08780.1 hypothetical protein [Myxococcus sp. CA040A]NTX11915.1 hypothetical protein [Myxococcus sp. CA056]NTX39191.1 hypothetical protein [Myxococcus sp. CA033]NTX50758.1 hypothetical protein [Myxococcus sp. CA039A]NTX65830.1 hypothetical protein [Myxococcus sp. CA051A]